MSLAINIIDYLVMLKYFHGMLGERRGKNKVAFGFYGCGFLLVGQYVNGLNNPYANLVYATLTAILTSLWYREKVSIKIPTILLYYGICILADVFAAWILMNLVDSPNSGQANIYAMAFSVAVRYFLLFSTRKCF